MTKHAKIKILPPLYWIPSTVLMLSLACTDVIPRMYWCYPPNVLKVLKLSPHCTDVIPHCTEQPPQYWSYPPQYWRYPPHVLLLSPNSTEGIPPQYWIPSTVLMLSTWRDWCYPPLYWTTSTVLKLSPTVLKLSPTVLNNLHSTEVVPPQYWSYPQTVLKLSPQCTEQPPMYWTTSNVLNNLHSTEPTLDGVVSDDKCELPLNLCKLWKIIMRKFYPKILRKVELSFSL